MKKLLALLLLLPMLALATPVPQVGKWIVISNDMMKDHDPGGSAYHGADGQKGVVDEYSGGAFAPDLGVLGSLLVFGGGHAGYAGNEVYKFNIDTGFWSRSNPDSTGDCPDLVLGEYADGAPCVPHDWNAVGYHPTTHSFVILGGSALCCNTSGTSATATVHLMNVNTNVWRRGGTRPWNNSVGAGEGACSAYDSSRGVFWYSPGWRAGSAPAVRAFSKYDPSANSGAGAWTAQVDAYVDAGCAMAIDPTLDIAVKMFGSNDSRGAGLEAYDLTQPNTQPIRLTISGDLTANNSGDNGFEWDSSAGKFVAWADGATVYTLTPPASNWQTHPWVWTAIPPAVGNANTPHNNSNGTFGRFRYVPGLNAFVVVNSVGGAAGDGNVYLYALDAAAPVATDFQARCAAAGVVLCRGMDLSSEFLTNGGNGPASCGANLTGGGANCPQADTTIKKSGVSSSELTCPRIADDNDCGGYLVTNIGHAFGPGETMYVQFSKRFSPEYLAQSANIGGSGPKDFLIYPSGASCTGLQIVIENTYHRGFPQAYSSCGGQPFVVNGLDPDGGSGGRQEQGDYTCYYHTQFNGPNSCAYYRPNVWMTFYVKATLGTWGTPSSKVEMWVGYEDVTDATGAVIMKKFIDYPGQQFNADTATQTFQQLLLLTYDSDRGAQDGIIDNAHVWFDELIVSTQPIAAPGGGAVVSNPLTATLSTNKANYSNSADPVLVTWACGGTGLTTCTANGGPVAWTTSGNNSGVAQSMGTFAAGVYTLGLQASDGTLVTNATPVTINVTAPSFPVFTTNFSASATNLSTSGTATPSFALGNTVNMFGTGITPESRTVILPLSQAPLAATIVNVSLTGDDIDDALEGNFVVNGNTAVNVSGVDYASCNNVVCTHTYATPSSYWHAGNNTVVFNHTQFAGYTVTQVDLSYPLTAGGPNPTTTNLSWTVTGAAQGCAASAVPANATWTGAQVLTGPVTVGPFVAGQTTLTLDCNNGGLHTIRTVNLSVDAPISLAFSANPTSFYANQSTTLTWSSANATACVASNGWSGAKALAGSEVLSGLAAGTVTLDLTCSNATASTMQEIILTVLPVIVNTPPTVTLSVDRNTATTADLVTASWFSNNATSCTTGNDWPSPGAVALSGSQSFTFPTTGQKILSITCLGFGSASDSKTVTVTSVIVPPPPTVAFSASTLSFFTNQSTTVTWSSTNAVSCTASNGWSGAKALSGSEVLSGFTAGNKTLVLTCTNPTGSTVQTILLNVLQVFPPPSVILHVDRTTATTADLVMVSWSSAHANVCGTSDDWPNPGQVATSGSQSFTLSAGTKTLTIGCTGNGFVFVSKNVTVTAGAGSPLTVTLSASPLSIYTNQSTTVTWSSANATSCTASGDWSGVKSLANSEVLSGFTAGVKVIDLTCSNATDTLTQEVLITVLPLVVNNPPTVTLSVNRVTVTTADLVTASWVSSNAGSCLSGGDWPSPGVVALNGSQSFALPVGVKVLSITCVGFGSASDSKTVTVSAVAMTMSFSASPTMVELGGRTVLTWNVTNASACHGENGMPGDTGWTNAPLVITAGNHTYQTVVITRPVNYTLRCLDTQSPPLTQTVLRSLNIGISSNPVHRSPKRHHRRNF